jgi:O-acetylserine/cysteine efflux transporter
LKKKDIVLGIIVVILWGLNYLAIKFGVDNIQPLVLLTIRFVVVSIPAIFILPKPPIEWKWLISIGLTLYFGQFVFLFTGIKFGMPTGLSSLVHQAQIFFTMGIAAFVLKEKWKLSQIIGLIIASIGIVVVGAQQGGTMTATGFWLTLAAAACWGTGNVIMRYATKDAPPFPMLSLVVWASAVAIIPLGILSFFVEGIDAWKAALGSINLVSIGAIIYLAYFASLIGYGLWGRLLSHYPAATVSPFSLLLPVIAMSSSALFLKETFTL